MKESFKTKCIKFLCNFILIPKLRRNIRNKLTQPKMIFNQDIKPVFESIEKPQVSVIIPVYNQYKMTYECLKSIAYYKPKVSFEIIIADDGSQDETQNIGENVPGVKVVKTDGNKGFLLNVKNAVKHAIGKYIFLMNNDMLVTDNWLDSLYNFMENHSDAGIAGSVNLKPYGQILEYGAYLDNEYKGHLCKPNDPVDTLSIKEAMYCSGCSIMFLKSDWDNLGGFDEQFSPAYYEDTDFNMQIKYKLNKKIYCIPESRIYHYLSRTYSKNKQIISENSRKKFIAKWGEILKLEDSKEALEESCTKE